MISRPEPEQVEDINQTMLLFKTTQLTATVGFLINFMSVSLAEPQWGSIKSDCLNNFTELTLNNKTQDVCRNCCLNAC